MDGESVACGAVKLIAPGVGSLKRMWVADGVRGLGIGRRVLEALEAQARELGLTTLRLDTNQTLEEAIWLVPERRLSRSSRLQLRSLRPALVRKTLELSVARTSWQWSFEQHRI